MGRVLRDVGPWVLGVLVLAVGAAAVVLRNGDSSTALYKALVKFPPAAALAVWFGRDAALGGV